MNNAIGLLRFMPSIGSRSDNDRICVINTDVDKGASDAIDSRSREMAHEFDGHVGAFTRAWYAFIKNGSNDGAGPYLEFVT